MNDYLHEHVGRFVKLEERGVMLAGLCPFHDEQTPSFCVNPATNTYHCFGCEAHGNVEDFEHDLSQRKAA